jgi:hypothetical protein
MTTTPSLAGIPFSRIHTRDPLIAQWALGSISDLRRWNETSADVAIRALFDEATICFLMSEFTDDFMLLCLFHELPDDLLQPHLPFLAEIWRKLPAWNSSYPLSLLARHLALDGVFFANVNLGERTDGKWREFPLVWRPYGFYRAAFQRHGMSVTDMGALEDYGHLTRHQDAAMAAAQRMLRAVAAPCV